MARVTLFSAYEPHSHGAPPPPGLRIRPATKDDLRALAPIRAARDEIPEDRALSIFEWLLERAGAGRSFVLVATVDEEPVGYGVVDRLERDGLPPGWYLGGVVVTPFHRRRGIGAALTRERLTWIAGRSQEAFYFVNSRNAASIDLHAPFGFVEIERGIKGPGVSFTGGIGLLFRLELSPAVGRSIDRSDAR